MKHSLFNQHIKDINEQFHVVQTNGTTEVHWIYGGFDIYERAQRRPQFQEPKRKGFTKKIKSFFDDADDAEQPLFHIIAEISEEREHVVHLDLDAQRIPEKMRRRLLPLVAEYVATPLAERGETIQSADVVIQSGDDIGKERHQAKVEAETKAKRAEKSEVSK